MEVEGLIINNVPIKKSAYADDVLLYIGDTASSIPPLLNVINTYSQFSGYTLNTNKTELFSLNVHCLPVMVPNKEIIWAKDKIKYLGILFSHSMKQSISLNCDCIFYYIKEKF